jgi:hypothetical protein
MTETSVVGKHKTGRNYKWLFMRIVKKSQIMVTEEKCK